MLKFTQLQIYGNSFIAVLISGGMKMSVAVTLKNAEPFFPKTVYGQMIKKAIKAHRMLFSKTGPNAECAGWVTLPEEISDEEVLKLEAAANEIRGSSDALVVIGIGGSYLGARAAVEFLKPSLEKQNSREKMPEILFAGNNLSSDYISGLIEHLKGMDFSLNVVSKSGTTTEPAVSFRILKKLLTEKYGEEEAVRRIYVTTDENEGLLTKYAEKAGYRRFFIPASVGGRYSVLSPVGLLPMAACGIDIRAVLKGAKDALSDLREENLESNPAIRYAGARGTLYHCGKTIEIFSSFEQHMSFLAEWWKQLFAESEGKEYGGVFPTSVTYTTDLHSLGQFIQEGKRSIFETIVEIASPENDISVPFEKDDFDGLNYLSGQTLKSINLRAMHAVTIAHFDGGVPIIGISVPRADEYSFGYLVYFFELACGISGYSLGIDPFNQPGVEDYKKNMFALLGKSGYEDRAKELKGRL